MAEKDVPLRGPDSLDPSNSGSAGCIQGPEDSTNNRAEARLASLMDRGGSPFFVLRRVIEPSSASQCIGEVGYAPYRAFPRSVQDPLEQHPQPMRCQIVRPRFIEAALKGRPDALGARGIMRAMKEAWEENKNSLGVRADGSMRVKVTGAELRDSEDEKSKWLLYNLDPSHLGKETDVLYAAAKKRMGKPLGGQFKPPHLIISHITDERILSSRPIADRVLQAAEEWKPDYVTLEQPIYTTNDLA